MMMMMMVVMMMMMMMMICRGSLARNDNLRLDPQLFP
jgi:hypothetical protein